MVNKLVDEVKGVSDRSRFPSVIKFMYLGFRDSFECWKWIEEHFGGLRYGLIVDPLLILDRIYGDEDEGNGSVIKMMQGRLNLKIETGAEASALNALRHARPRIFHKGRPAMVTVPNKSRLNLLPTYNEWNGGGEGVVSFIQSRMGVVSNSITMDITNEFGGDPTRYQAQIIAAQIIATAALANSVAFLNQMITTVEGIYQRLHNFSKFTSVQAWSLTTQVLDRILADLYVPKSCVSESVLSGNPRSTCIHVLFAVFKTQDIMTTYIDHQFENHPPVSTEYVSFLATNSGSEKVTKLEEVVDGIKNKTTSPAAGDAAKAMAKADTASSKYADLAKEVAALTRKIKTLEDKAGR